MGSPTILVHGGGVYPDPGYKYLPRGRPFLATSCEIRRKGRDYSVPHCNPPLLNTCALPLPPECSVRQSFYVPQGWDGWSSRSADGRDLARSRKQTIHDELLANFSDEGPIIRLREVELFSAVPAAWQLVQERHPDANPWRPVREVSVPAATTANEKRFPVEAVHEVVLSETAMGRKHEHRASPSIPSLKSPVSGDRSPVSGNWSEGKGSLRYSP